MQQQFLPSGRVQYFPMCEYEGKTTFASRVSAARYEVTVRNKVVDSTYMNVTVPSMRAPQFEVAPELTCVPPNALPRISAQADQYVVIGAGKTGMDACLWLLGNQVAPEAITWIMPRDSWLLDRATIQPGGIFAGGIAAGFARQFEVTAKAESIEDLFNGLNDCGQLLRFDDNVWPTMYRCATVTQAELDQLRRIPNIVRKGRVERIEADSIILTEGTEATSPAALYIDCTADGLERRPVLPVFEPRQITLQSVRTCQQVFSAAFIGHVEAAYEDETIKNELCTVVPHPDSHIDWLRTSLGNAMNQARWASDPQLQEWLVNSRLDGFSGLGAIMSGEDPDSQALVQSLEENALPAMAKLQALLGEVDENS
jgi:hypothetical protein